MGRIRTLTPNSFSTDDKWSVVEYVSDLGMLGWVTMELANDDNPSYDQTVDDLIWKYRKTLNAYFRRDD